MRFQRLKAQAFGCLKDWESPPLKPGLILVCGRNESGKSTLFNLITTLFYGWYPANRDANPYVPWGEAEAACEGELLLEEGEVVTVSRRLRSTPIGMLIQEDEVVEIRNRTLPYVEVLPRDVFREVYAIELRNLKFPEHSAWEAMQQQLLGGQFSSFLRPVSEVVRELDDEANRLWRPDRRGRPRARDIGERLKELRASLEEARAREERLRRAQMELVERQRMLEKDIARKAELMAYIDRCERLNPVRKKLKRIQELKEASAYASDYDDLPPDPAQRLEYIDRQLEDLRLQRARLEGKKRQLEGVIKACTERDKALLNHAGEIKLLVKSYDRIKADQDELNNIETDIKSWGEQLRRHASEVLVGGWKPELAEIVNAVDAAALKAGIDSFRQAREQYQEQLNRVEALRVRLGQRRGARYVPWLSGAFSIMGMLGFILSGASAMRFVSAIVMVTGVVLLLAWWLFGGRTAEYGELELEERRLAQLHDRVNEERSQIQKLIKGVPLALQRLENPDSTLLVDIGRLKELLERIKESSRRRDVLVERIKQNEHRVLKLLKACGLDKNGVESFRLLRDSEHHDGDSNVSGSRLSSANTCSDFGAGNFGVVYSGYSHGIDVARQGDVLSAIDLLEVALQEAERRYQDAQAAKSQMEDLESELSRVNGTVVQLEREKNYILGRLEELPGEDINARIDGLMKARELARQADSFLEDLRRDYPDLDDIRQQIMELTQKDEEWIFDDEMLARAKAERDQIEQELNALNSEIGTLKKEIELGMGQGNMDEIEGEIAVLEWELKKIARQRDRILLLKNLILEAEKRFREEHQPDVLKKAGRYLSIITDGRYTRLFTKEGQQAGLLVKCGYSDELIEVGEGFLSRGTLEQIYLSLRLAFIEHLDPGGRPMPVFLDEVFVNWDGFRLDNGFGLLKELAQQRQVFIFTCHDWLVERLVGKLDVQVVELQI